MANGLDRLERFFAKRKASAASAETSDPVIPPVVQAAEPQFPSPSFIRPKTTRMAAREEFRVNQSAGRSPRTESSSPNRKGSITTQTSASTTSSYRLHFSPERSSSLQTHYFIPEFKDFKFPRPPTHSGGSSSASSTSGAKSSFEFPAQRSPRSCSPGKPDDTPQRFDTPPTSDLEDDDLRGPRYFRNKKLPELPCGAPPTPDPSPELRPVQDSHLRRSQSIETLNTSVYRDIYCHLGEPFDYPPLRRSRSQFSLAPSSSSSTLREPDCNEFFNLSDDDIAETTIPGSLQSELMEGSSQKSSMFTPANTLPNSQASITLTPPYASQPATAAAFEAARIAKRYNFDLVYVVNLWPLNAESTTSDSDQDNSSFKSDNSNVSSQGMTGRLLAAYGLHNVASPFEISTIVHKRMLRSNGWIEYRNQDDRDARNDEFARGYASAFHTGHCSADGSALSSSCSKDRPRKPDRGIVFAAFRKPRPDGSMIGVSSDKSELEAVHRDAEVLVEMLVDIHVTNQLRQPRPHCQYSDDETGPMPVERFQSR
ncbi:hypothetical protein G7046_g624 [Stylonectria norvegica]|nr:hypothetical protein G7046_g624 [Stylonectria norvegica]